MERVNFMKGIVLLQEQFGKVLSKPMLEEYWKSVSMMSDADFERAYERVRNDCKFFPMPADLREGIMPKFDPDGPALVAWSKVAYARTAPNQNGRHNSVLAFDDLNIHRAIPLVDVWETIRDCDDERLPFIKREFVKCYNITARDPDAHPCPRTVGDDWDYPMFIGDREIAEKNFTALTIKKKDGK